TLLAGTLAAFQIAYSGGADLSNGGHEGMVNLSGLLSDEYIHAETFPDRQNVDVRNINPGNGAVKGVFFDLSQARALADLTSDRYNTFDPGTAGHSEVLSIGAYAYLMFAENFCSGVPFSRFTDEGDVEYGQPQTREEILDIALAKFDSALAFATAQGRDDLAHLANVGRARVLLNQGNFAQAAVAAATVSPDFVYAIESSANSTRQNNGIWNYTTNFFGFSVPESEGGNGLAWRSANDPRLPWQDVGSPGFDGETPFFVQEKYPTLDAATPLATGVEAQLIVAEAALQSGNAGMMRQILTQARQRADMPAVADPGTADGQIDLLFAERGFWLYLTGHRLGDLRRLVRQYGRAADAVFPTGPYHKGGEYGSDVNFPVSGDERNNPNFTGCIDREA
ncbi:MAG TPA: RagB/SusD family nutrient uptake outer membrane protein, partial [Gemmatimonadaceae bacterium]